MPQYDLGSALGAAAAQLNQNVAQLNSHMRAAVDGAAQAINGYYLEAKRYVRAFDENRGLRYRAATISLSATIVGAGTAASGSADFRIAQNEDFLVKSIRGFIVLNDLASEAATFANLAGSTSVVDRLAARAANCRVTLLNKDTKVPYTENEGIGLATLTPEAGGQPMVFQPDVVPGFILPHNMTVQAQFALQSANAFFNTASTSYGITLSGIYVTREVR